MAFKESITADDVVHFLNELLLADREAVHELIHTRIPVNSDFAKHPSVMVLRIGDQEKVGILGILNGLFGNINGWGPIMAFQQEGQIVTFMRTPKDQYADARNIGTSSSNG